MVMEMRLVRLDRHRDIGRCQATTICLFLAPTQALALDLVVRAADHKNRGVSLAARKLDATNLVSRDDQGTRRETVHIASMRAITNQAALAGAEAVFLAGWAADSEVVGRKPLVDTCICSESGMLQRHELYGSFGTEKDTPDMLDSKNAPTIASKAE